MPLGSHRHLRQQQYQEDIFKLMAEQQRLLRKYEAWKERLVASDRDLDAELAGRLAMAIMSFRGAGKWLRAMASCW